MTADALFDTDMRPDPALCGVLVRRDATKTSRDAALRAYPRSGTARERVLTAITQAGGLTDEEIAIRLRMSPNTARPRRNELVAGGWITDSGVRRPTAMGCDSIVWVAC